MKSLLVLCLVLAVHVHAKLYCTVYSDTRPWYMASWCHCVAFPRCFTPVYVSERTGIYFSIVYQGEAHGNGARILSRISKQLPTIWHIVLLAHVVGHGHRQHQPKRCAQRRHGWPGRTHIRHEHGYARLCVCLYACVYASLFPHPQPPRLAWVVVLQTCAFNTLVFCLVLFFLSPSPSYIPSVGSRAPSHLASNHCNLECLCRQHRVAVGWFVSFIDHSSSSVFGSSIECVIKTRTNTFESMSVPLISIQLSHA